MPIYKKSASPTQWKRMMYKSREPICDSKPVLYTEPHKRKMTNHFDMSTPRGMVENVNDDLVNALTPSPLLNETECRTVCALYNHRHLRRNQMSLIRANLAYRKSLGNFGLCGNCEKPINTKVSKINSGNSGQIEVVNRGYEQIKVSVPEGLTPKEVEYADIPEHCVVVQDEKNPQKARFIRVSKTRVFNQKCMCGSSMRDLLK